MKKILVTGASGQIGSELTPELRKKYGKENVLATDVKLPKKKMLESGPFEFLDVLNRDVCREVIKGYDIKIIYHLAAILSAKGEKNPDLAWDINIDGLKNILEISRENSIEKIFWPSSIAVFSSETPRDNTPQLTVMRPKTVYGITKVAGELLCEYYFQRFGLDVRGVRYPGIISSETLPGGGTTDYAVEIFYEAIKHKRYTCFLKEDTVLPMMYIPDCIKAAIELMEFDGKLNHKFFNLAAMSFSPKELTLEIRKHIPDFTCEYKPDFRQKIADSWPKTIDDSVAREEWGWKPEYNLEEMTKNMLEKLSLKKFKSI
jgi:nucleoside-diphosphate-sugar epimerase